jgi:hypothetical protein
VFGEAEAKTDAEAHRRRGREQPTEPFFNETARDIGFGGSTTQFWHDYSTMPPAAQGAV